MLKKDQVKAIATMLKMDPVKVQAAVDAPDEQEIELPADIKVFTPTELESRDKNIKSAGYNEGATVGRETVVKELKTEHGITIEGKDPKSFIEAYKAKVLADAKLAPNDAIKEKETIITNLQANLAKLQGEKAEVEGTLKKTRLNGQLYKQVPALGVELEPDEVISSMQGKGYTFEEDENGNVLPKLNGNVIRDQATQNPLAVKDVISGYVTERKWAKEENPSPTGRGGGNSNHPATGKVTSLSEAETAWKAEGKNPNGSEFQAHVAKLAKEVPDFKME